MIYVIVTILAFILVTGVGVLNAWVTTWLWLWFVVPVFHLPELTVLQAIGLALVISCCRGWGSLKKDPRPVDYYKLSGLVLGPLLALALGFWLKGYV